MPDVSFYKEKKMNMAGKNELKQPYGPVWWASMINLHVSPIQLIIIIVCIIIKQKHHRFFLNKAPSFFTSHSFDYMTNIDLPYNLRSVQVHTLLCIYVHMVKLGSIKIIGWFGLYFFVDHHVVPNQLLMCSSLISILSCIGYFPCFL